MSLQIHALQVGMLRDFPTAALTYQHGWGETRDVPQIMFVITGGAKPVIVDTGTPPAEHVRSIHGYDFERTESEDPRRALASIGVDPNDVEVVVNTHLHWDHCGGNALFANATFYVQRAELEYARDPFPHNRKAFEQVGDVVPSWLATEEQIHPVDGDLDLGGGISLVSLPGHTPGSQGVLVQAASTRYLIAGDTVNLYRNWLGSGGLKHIINGSFYSLPDFMESFTKIERLDAEVIPSHDPDVLARGVFD